MLPRLLRLAHDEVLLALDGEPTVNYERCPVKNDTSSEHKKTMPDAARELLARYLSKPTTVTHIVNIGHGIAQWREATAENAQYKGHAPRRPRRS